MKYELRDIGRLYRINDDGTERYMGRDSGQPEDNTFARDWDWVPVELNHLAAEIRTLRDEREKTNARLASVSCVLQDIVFEIFDQRWDEFEFEQYELGKRARIALGNEDVGSEA